MAVDPKMWRQIPRFQNGTIFAAARPTIYLENMARHIPGGVRSAGANRHTF